MYFIVYNEGILCQPKPCNRKFYPDGFVCVCNSSYCDTVESVDKIDSNNFYQEFVTSKSRYRLEKFKFKFDLFPSKGNNCHTVTISSFKIILVNRSEIISIKKII